MSRIILDLMTDACTEATAEDLNITDRDDLTADDVLTALKKWGNFWEVASDFGLMGNATIFVQVLHELPRGRTVRSHAEWGLE